MVKTVDVRDRSYSCHRNGPEDDECADKGDGHDVSDDTFPPFDPEILPDDFVGVDADKAGAHVQGLVMGCVVQRSEHKPSSCSAEGLTNHLICRLRVRLGIELCKDGADKFCFSGTVSGSVCFDLWKQALKLGP